MLNVIAIGSGICLNMLMVVASGPSSPSSSGTKGRRPLFTLLIALAIVILVPVVFILYIIIGASIKDQQTKSLLMSRKADIVIPSDCSQTDEGYISGIDNGQRYNVNFHCNLRYTDDTIASTLNPYLKNAYVEKGYAYDPDQKWAIKDDVMISYYLDTANDSGSTNVISVNIEKNH